MTASKGIGRGACTSEADGRHFRGGSFSPDAQAKSVAAQKRNGTGNCAPGVKSKAGKISAHNRHHSDGLLRPECDVCMGLFDE